MLLQMFDEKFKDEFSLHASRSPAHNHTVSALATIASMLRRSSSWSTGAQWIHDEHTKL